METVISANLAIAMIRRDRDRRDRIFLISTDMIFSAIVIVTIVVIGKMNDFTVSIWSLWLSEILFSAILAIVAIIRKPCRPTRIHTNINQIYDRNNRQSQFNFALTKPKTNFIKKLFGYRSALDWNNLSSEIKIADSVNIFKERLNNNLIFNFLSLCY